MLGNTRFPPARVVAINRKYKYKAPIMRMNDKEYHPELTVIDYDRFIPDYAGNEQKYMADGIHITPA